MSISIHGDAAVAGQGAGHGHRRAGTATAAAPAATASSWHHVGRNRLPGWRTGGSRRTPARRTGSGNARRTPSRRRPDRSAANPAGTARPTGGQPPAGRQQLGVGGALGAQPAAIRRMQPVALDPRDDRPARLGVDLDTAAHAAVRARRPGHRHGAMVDGRCSGYLPPTLAPRRLALTARPSAR